MHVVIKYISWLQNMTFWETVFTIILLLFAARVCSTSQPAQKWMHHNPLEVTLINALHANKTNQEQISRHFCSPQLLLNVNFLVSIAQQHLKRPSPAGKLIRVKRTYEQKNVTNFYNFLVTTSPLLMVVDPQFYCQLKPHLPSIIQNVTCQFSWLPCCKSTTMDSERCYISQRIELSLYAQHIPATVSEQDIQTALERILQKVWFNCCYLFHLSSVYISIARQNYQTWSTWGSTARYHLQCDLDSNLYDNGLYHPLMYNIHRLLDVLLRLVKEKSNGNTMSFLNNKHVKENFRVSFYW